MVRTSSITMPSGDRGSRAGCRRKSVMFFVCFCHAFEFKVRDNGNAMKQCNIQNNYGTVTVTTMREGKLGYPEFRRFSV